MIDEPTIEQLTSDVCTTMLGLNLIPSADAYADNSGGLYCAHIEIEGDWHIQLFVICPAELAHHIAATMFMMEPDELSDEETGDAMGELVNIIGGNVKGIIPGENSLSLPTVLCLDAQQVTEQKGQNTDVHFLCEGHALTIRYSEPAESCAPKNAAVHN